MPIKKKEGKCSEVTSSPLEGELIPASLETHQTHVIAIALNNFIGTIDDYRGALLTTIPAIEKRYTEQLNSLNRKIKKFESQVNDDGTSTLKAEGAHDAKELFDTVAELNKFKNSNQFELITKTFFIGLFSEYDHFIGELLKAIYKTNPNLYKGIKREISLTELLDFNTISEIKIDMLEKEIDAFRRDGYIEQFNSLERMFEIKTLKMFKEWPIFVEMSQRRNLLTHNGGYVSQQYLQVCDKEKVDFKTARPTVGDKLELDAKYMANAMLIISKIGFMLAHTLWRKISPSDVQLANKEMNQTIYKILHDKRWKVAASFGEFALTDPVKKGMQEIDLKIRLINQSLALKKLKLTEEMNLLLSSADFSASLREFSLAKAVLEDKYSEAAKIMRNIGKQGELIHEIAYHTWPLFDEFRGTVEFQTAYEEIFRIPFIKKVSEGVQQEPCAKKPQRKTRKKGN